MKRRLVFYPTLYKDVVVHTPTRKKIGTLTAFYSHGVGGFDLRPFVLEILEKKYEHSDYPRLQKACISSEGG